MKLKKYLTGTLALIAMSSLLAVGTSAFAEQEVSVFVDNSKVGFDQAPIIQDGRTLVPVRAVFEKAGAEVEWDQATQTAIMTRGNYVVKIKYGDSFLYKNDQPVPLDVPATMENDRILIPVRAISEAMDFGVSWNGVRYSVLISTNGKAYRPLSQWDTGFRSLRDSAEFYADYNFNSLEIDLNGDGTKDLLSFAKASPVDGDELANLLVINGTDFSSVLQGMDNISGIALVDIKHSDKTKELVILENSSPNYAWFFRYDGTNLVSLAKNGNAPCELPYVDKLFFDGKGNVFSDLDGVCFTDIMSIAGMYTMENLTDASGNILQTNGSLNQYRLDETTSEGHDYYPAYDDTMTYWVKYTDDYQPGACINGEEKGADTMNALDFPDKFHVLDTYVDDTNPSKFELFVQFSDGKKAVIWSYYV